MPTLNQEPRVPILLSLVPYPNIATPSRTDRRRRVRRAVRSEQSPGRPGLGAGTPGLPDGAGRAGRVALLPRPPLWGGTRPRGCAPKRVVQPRAAGG